MLDKLVNTVLYKNKNSSFILMFSIFMLSFWLLLYMNVLSSQGQSLPNPEDVFKLLTADSTTHCHLYDHTQHFHSHTESERKAQKVRMMVYCWHFSVWDD